MIKQIDTALKVSHFCQSSHSTHPQCFDAGWVMPGREGKRRRAGTASVPVFALDPALLERVTTDTDPTRPGRATDARLSKIPPPPIAVKP